MRFKKKFEMKNVECKKNFSNEKFIQWEWLNIPLLWCQLKIFFESYNSLKISSVFLVFKEKNMYLADFLSQICFSSSANFWKKSARYNTIHRVYVSQMMLYILSFFNGTIKDLSHQYKFEVFHERS